MFSIVNIDTVDKSCQIDAFPEIRLRSIAEIDGKQFIRKMLKYLASQETILSALTSRIKYRTRVVGNVRVYHRGDSLYDFCFKFD